jgi:hypothetical protein
MLNRLRLGVLVSLLALGLSGQAANALTISATDLTPGASNVVVSGANVSAVGGTFSGKSASGVYGVGVGGGYTDAEIDLAGEGIRFVFEGPLTVTSLDLTFLFAAPAWFDSANEVAKVSFVSGGTTYEATLTVTGDTTATWSFGGGGAVTNLSIANQTGAALWSIANPFGQLAVSELTLLPTDANGTSNASNADYAFAGLVGVPEPTTLALLLLGLGGLAVGSRFRI